MTNSTTLKDLKDAQIKLLDSSADVKRFDVVEDDGNIVTYWFGPDFVSGADSYEPDAPLMTVPLKTQHDIVSFITSDGFIDAVTPNKKMSKANKVPLDRLKPLALLIEMMAELNFREMSKEKPKKSKKKAVQDVSEARLAS